MSKKILSALPAFLFALARVSADAPVVNPAPGVWANRQALALSLQPGDEAFYSLNGADPESTGFAYDGPVLIDVAGPVTARVSVVSKDGRRENFSVSYTVDESLPDDGVAREFVESHKASGTIDYQAGSVLRIPESLSYSMGNFPESLEKGGPISYSAACILSRDIPCSLTDGSRRWRFVIRAMPSRGGSFSRRSLPFSVDEWDEISLDDKRFIYRVDDGMWIPPGRKVAVDRTAERKISWQSVAYEPGNPIESFSLPPKPTLAVRKSPDGSVAVFLRGDPGYRLGAENSGAAAFFEAAVIDTFPGDEARGTLMASVYFDGARQGSMPVEYDVARRRPSPPVFTSSAKSFYSRDEVSLRVSGEKGSELFIAQSEPWPVGEDGADEGSPPSVDAGEYKSAGGASEMSLRLSSEESAVYRKVSAYSIDANGNKSDAAEYGVVIDRYNYYIDSSADPAVADGSRARPFASFDGCSGILGKSRFARVTVSGKVEMPKGETVISSNCAIEGRPGSSLVFGAGSFVTVRSASLDLKNIVVERDDSSDLSVNNVPLFNLEFSTLRMDGCEAFASFNKNGTVIAASVSVVSVKNSGVASQSSVYSSALSAVSTKIKIERSRISTVSLTAVNLSAQGGDFELRSSSCKVSGAYGRPVELFGTRSKITGNTFEADLSSASKTGDEVYRDAKNVSLEYSGNSVKRP